MKVPTGRRLIIPTAAAVAILSAVVLVPPALAAPLQQLPATMHAASGHGGTPGTGEHEGGSAAHPSQPSGTMPTMPGQEAFGTIQEIVRILEADPKTDWSKVNLEGLRQHLIDMNELTLNAHAVAARIDGGLRITVTGSGRTLAAIQRMVPAHAPMIDGHKGWQVTATLLPNGARLTATASDARESAHIRGLGFIGLMATGAHHQAHHLAIAEGKHPMHTY